MLQGAVCQRHQDVLRLGRFPHLTDMDYQAMFLIREEVIPSLIHLYF